MSTIRPFRFAVQPLSKSVNILQNHDELVRVARLAEDLGYEELYIPDHFGSVDPFIPACIAAEATSTLRVGTLVLNNEFHHPAMLARTAATLDRLSGGRFILGCGTGYAAREHDATGIELRAPKDRVTRFGECMAAVRLLLDEGAAHVDGEHVSMHIDQLGVRPAQARLPLLIGGHGRRVVTIAGQHCDIYQFTGMEHGPRGEIQPNGFDMASLRQRASWLNDAAGDRADSIERSALVQATELGESIDFDKTAQEFEVELDTVLESPFILQGSRSQIAEKLHRCREELGISHIVIRDAEAFAPIVAQLAGC
jgi:probable F420-dependent oxidoreductase